MTLWKTPLINLKEFNTIKDEYIRCKNYRIAKVPG